MRRIMGEVLKNIQKNEFCVLILEYVGSIIKVSTNVYLEENI